MINVHTLCRILKCSLMTQDFSHFFLSLTQDFSQLFLFLSFFVKMFLSYLCLFYSFFLDHWVQRMFKLVCIGLDLVLKILHFFVVNRHSHSRCFSILSTLEGFLFSYHYFYLNCHFAFCSDLSFQAIQLFYGEF
jgi:hypothetical protein